MDITITPTIDDIWYASPYTPTETFYLERTRLRVGTNLETGSVISPAIYSGESEPTSLVGWLFPDVLSGTAQNRYFWTPGPPGTTLTLNAGTKYWVVIGFSPTNSPTFTLGVNNAKVGSTILSKVHGGWVLEQSDWSIAFTLYNGGEIATRFFEYRGALYAVRNLVGGKAPKLYMNGYRGFAASGSTIEKIVTTVDYSAASLAGDTFVKIVAGPGSAESQSWRKIISVNTTSGASSLIVDKAWSVPPTTASEYVSSIQIPGRRSQRQRTA
jgi:hypothetical protein